MICIYSILLAAPPVASERVGEPMMGIQNIDTMEMFGKMMFGLLVVIGLIFIVRFLLNGRRSLSKTGNIRVIEMVPFGKERFLAVVEVIGKILVIGVTEQNVNLLVDITDKEVVDNLKIQESQRLPGGIFSNVLASLGVNMKNPVGTGNDNSPRSSLKKEDEILFIHNQMERIKHLSPGNDLTGN